MYHKKFTIDYFLKKYDDIPDEYFSLSSEPNATDAWEWMETNEEADALHKMIKPFGILLQVNDGEDEWQSLGLTPKIRVMKFLSIVKRGMSPDRWVDNR